MHEHSKELSSRAVAYIGIDDLFGISASPMVKDAIEAAAANIPIVEMDINNSNTSLKTLLSVWSDGRKDLDMDSTTSAFQVRIPTCHDS